MLGTVDQCRPLGRISRIEIEADNETLGTDWSLNFTHFLTMTGDGVKCNITLGKKWAETPHCRVLERGYGQIGKHNRSWDHLIMKCCSGTIQKGTPLHPLNENIFDSKSTCSKLSYHRVKSAHAFIIKMQIIRWWEKEVFLVATPLSSCQGKQ